METSSLPLHFDPYSFNIKEGDNSLCLHTRENEYRLWESCQDLQGEKAESYFYWFRPTADKLKAISSSKFLIFEILIPASGTIS